MMQDSNLLTDPFGRRHNYLRISLIEKCNLRCTYCMPSEGVQLSPKAELMTAQEVFDIAQTFVAHGVNKIRLTGGEPLLRKDFGEIIALLSRLPISIAVTTNGVLLDKYMPLLKENGVRKLNISIDTLDPPTFNKLTLRDQFHRVLQNIQQAHAEGFEIKLNAVLLRDQNEHEINSFLELTREQNLQIRFIEFMPFKGNQWDSSKAVSLQQILEIVHHKYGRSNCLRIEDQPNDTAKNFKIKGFKGSFAIISTVSQPFCSTCNRLRLTANGRLRNCLFSENELDLLAALRASEPLEPIIAKAVWTKKAVRAGLESPEEFDNYQNHQNNRSMIRIGG